MLRPSPVLLLATFVCAAATALPHQPGEPEGIDQYHRAETLVYSDDQSTAEIEILLADVRRELRIESNRSLRSYWIARTHLLLASYYNQRNRTDLAEEQANLGFTAIEDALGRAGEFSEGLRVQADLHAQMMFARGLIYMARNGREARRQALRAMELDPNNTKARITAAGFYLNAPGFAGGDAEAGTAILESSLARDPDDKCDRFLIAGLLAQRYVDSGATARAAQYLQQAEEVFPGSPWLAELRGKIQP